jgi:NADPH:quinone reductase-like Zn-dependent oxidoreductase
MKAALYTGYGSPDVVRITDVDQPVPKDNEVLIRVHVAAVNPLDSHLMRGKPYVMRLAFGLRKPRDTRVGRDVAGVVEAAGRSVSQFKAGDEVFGVCLGAFAEYACASESKLAVKPGNVSFEQAAAAPIAALTALQALRDHGRIQAGQKVLINGAAGGVGTFAVQIAKSFGADVTGVCSTGSAGLVQSLGADHVIDYTREDFTRRREQYDLIFDLVANHSLRAYRRILNPNGTYVAAGALSGGGMTDFMALVIKPPIFSRFVSQKMLTFMARATREDMATIGRLMESGQMTSVIDRRYKLSEVAEAIRYVAEKHARGKVIITVP